MSLTAFAGAALGALWRERRYTAAQMQAVQRQKLRELLAFAQTHTKLGASRLSGINREEPDLSTVVPITKQALMADFDASISQGRLQFEAVRRFTETESLVGQALDGRYICATTSGTTGRPGYFVNDRRSWSQTNGALIARTLRHRLVPHEILRFSPLRRYRMAMMVATDGHFITKLVSTFQPWFAKGIMQMQAFSIIDALAETLAGLNEYQPHYLHSYPTYLEMLAHAQLSGKLHIDPEFISLGSEPVSALARQTLVAAFPNAELSETYGATECLMLGNQCKQGKLHANIDLCVIEPVDADGEPVPAGVASHKVFVTNLLNRAQPLIRYELNDSVTLFDEPCACGVGLPVMAVDGRSDDTFYLRGPEGEYRPFPPVQFEVLFLNVRGLQQYQLVHLTQNALLIRLVLDPEVDRGELRDLVLAKFRAHFAKDGLRDAVQLDLEVVPSLQREATGHKLRQILSRVPAPASSLVA